MTKRYIQNLQYILLIKAALNEGYLKVSDKLNLEKKDFLLIVSKIIKNIAKRKGLDITLISEANGYVSLHDLNMDVYREMKKQYLDNYSFIEYVPEINSTLTIMFLTNRSYNYEFFFFFKYMEYLFTQIKLSEEKNAATGNT